LRAQPSSIPRASSAKYGFVLLGTTRPIVVVERAFSDRATADGT
jgi:hypothetical protein